MQAFFFSSITRIKRPCMFVWQPIPLTPVIILFFTLFLLRINKLITSLSYYARYDWSTSLERGHILLRGLLNFKAVFFFNSEYFVIYCQVFLASSHVHAWVEKGTVNLSCQEQRPGLEAVPLDPNSSTLTSRTSCLLLIPEELQKKYLHCL